jgi:hypothetical protein
MRQTYHIRITLRIDTFWGLAAMSTIYFFMIVLSIGSGRSTFGCPKRQVCKHDTATCTSVEKSLGMFWKCPDSIGGISRTIPYLSRALCALLTNINTSIGEAHFLTKLITVINTCIFHVTLLPLTRSLCPILWRLVLVRRST